MNRDSRVGLQLTKPDNSQPSFKSGRKKRQLMTPVSPEHLKEILNYSRDVNEAVMQIEAISTGAQLAPTLRGGAQGGGGQVDMAALEKIILQRVDNEIAQREEKVAAERAQQNARIVELEKQLEEASKPKTAGRKKAAKKAGRKPQKGGVVERLQEKAKAKMDADGLPILSDEQQKQLGNVMGGFAAKD